MMRIRALNEASSGSESEDDDNPRLSREAQEAQAKGLYEKAQMLTVKQEYGQAVETFIEILELPFVNGMTDAECKTLSPVQLQLRLGCLKCLSTLYTRDPTKDLERAAVILEMVTDMEPKNVNFWYRLGKVAVEIRDLELAFDAFKRALDCSPGHWGSIENLVTISYALHDLLGCLRFCAIGLSKDSGFIKGHVFKSQVFKNHSWVENAVTANKSEYESLFVTPINVHESYERKYLEEARDLIAQVANKNKEKKIKLKKEESQVLECHLKLKSPTLVDLGKLVLEFYDYLESHRKLLQPVNMSAVETVQTEETITVPQHEIENHINGHSEEASSSASATACMRSRSTSEDKEENAQDSGDAPTRCEDAGEMDEKAIEEDSQALDDEASQRKKNRKDVKWWQIEGQRRSQRVRGNLVTTPSRPKPESTFAETLRNIIPPPLLLEESRQMRAGNNGKQFSHKSNIVTVQEYFGTIEERQNVAELLNKWKAQNILQIITTLVRWLSRNCRGHWSDELRKTFLDLYQLYRSSTPILFTTDSETASIESVEDDTFALLAHLEIIVDSEDIESSVQSSLFILENCGSYIIPSSSYYLRLEWLKAKNYLQRCRKGLLDYASTTPQLGLIIRMLEKEENDFICFTPSENDYVISSVHLQEKIAFVKKIENLSKIEELYKERQYQDLIDILLFSLSSDSSDDIKNHLYLTESYLELEKPECVQQCEICLDIAAKSGSEDKILEILNLVDRIWNKLKDQMSIKEYKIMIGMLLKILILVEKQSNGNKEVLMTQPWCLLHTVLYYLESNQSSFFMEDDSVPNSILILQMGHEILSKIGKCCINNGHFLLYSIDHLLEMQDLEDYASFEETKGCLDQTIFCLYGHPNSKKFKLKNIKDHGSLGMPLDWEACCKLYDYYKPEEIPEFDSRSSKCISAEAENLFQRIVSEIMPSDIKPTKRYEQIKKFVEGKSDVPDSILTKGIAMKIPDIFYLMADFHLKNGNLKDGVEFYTWDLAVCPLRFDSWSAISLATLEDIVAKINACEAYNIGEIIEESEAVTRCFNQALALDVANCKVRIEFGTFLYSMHSIFSRELKFRNQMLKGELIEKIEQKKTDCLLQAKSLFEIYRAPLNSEDEDDSNHEDAWINHYMLGKISEKLQPNEPEKFLIQYEKASQLLHSLCKTYPAKIFYNKNSVPEYTLEPLELYYRIHSGILTFIQRTKEYKKETDELLLSFLRNAEQSPFAKSGKHNRSQDGEGKKKDSISKKEKAILESIMNGLLDKIEKMVSEEPKTTLSSSSNTNSSSETSTSSSEEDSNQALTPIVPEIKSFALSEFRDRIREENAAAAENEKVAAEKRKKLEEQKSKNNNKNKHVKSKTDTNQFLGQFSSLPYGLAIAKCLKAMKECYLRYPQCFKAYFKISKSFVFFKKDFRTARDYLLGKNAAGPDRISGLYGERKPSNFFNGIWRNPVEDLDRPGSFAFHMSKAMQLLLSVLTELGDHQMLVEVGIQLAKIPDSKNTYLYTEDRDQYSKEAFAFCEKAARNSIPQPMETVSQITECGLSIYDTYTKFQKHISCNNKITNVVAPVLFDLYKRYVEIQMGPVESVTQADAVKFFQHIVWKTKTMGSGSKNTMVPPTHSQSFQSAGQRMASNSFSSSNPIMRKHNIQRQNSDFNSRDYISNAIRQLTQNVSAGSQARQPNMPSTLPLSSDSLNNFNSLNSVDYLMAQLTSTHLVNSFLAAQMSSLTGQKINTMDNSTSDQQRLQEIYKGAIQNSTKQNTNYIQPTPSHQPSASSANPHQQMLYNFAHAMKKCTPPKSNKVVTTGCNKLRLKKVEKSFSTSAMMSGTSSLDSKVQTASAVKLPKVPNFPIKAFNKVMIGQTEISPSTNVSQLPEMRKSTSFEFQYPQISLKSTNCITNNKPIKRRQTTTALTNQKPRSNSSNMGSQNSTITSPSYLSSSPFQAKLIAMTNPAIPGRSSNNQNSQQSSLSSTMPQPAHSYPRLQQQPRLSSNIEPEIVDLTTKSPEKNNTNGNTTINTASYCNNNNNMIQRNISKPQSGNNQKKINTLKSQPSFTQKQQVSTINKPATGGSSNTFQPTPIPLLRLIETSNLGQKNNSPILSVPSPSVVVPRPYTVKRPMESPGHYPLPPKKKHLASMPFNVQSFDRQGDDDAEIANRKMYEYNPSADPL